MTILARTGSFGYTLRTNDEFLPKNASIIAAFVNNNGKVIGVTHTSNELTRKGVTATALQSMPRTFNEGTADDADLLKAVVSWVTVNDEHLTNVIAAAIDNNEVPETALTAAMTELIDSDSLPALDATDLWAQFRTRGPVGREVTRRLEATRSLSVWATRGYTSREEMDRALA
jgi:hypothetical protein